MTSVLESLTVTDCGDQQFSGATAEPSLPTLYGGQVFAQALASAQATVSDDRLAHSMHAYFLRAGDPDAAINFTVATLRDGGSFSTRSMDVRQQDKTIFGAVCSFQSASEGPAFEPVVVPSAISPESLETQQQFWGRAELGIPGGKWLEWEQHQDWDIRLSDWDSTLSRECLPPRYQLWIRFRSELTEEQLSPAFQQRLLAYISDYKLVTAALLPQPMHIFSGDVQVASIDHTIWFHKHHDMRQWLRYDIECDWSGGGRSLNTGAMYNEEGELIASMRQEGLLRPRKK